MAAPLFLETRVLTPEGFLFEGQTLAVSGTNNTGKFAILPGHANFVSIVYDTLLLHTSKHEAQEIMVNNGVLACSNNKVDIYVGIIEQAPPAPSAASAGPQPAMTRPASSPRS